LKPCFDTISTVTDWDYKGHTV